MITLSMREWPPAPGAHPARIAGDAVHVWAAALDDPAHDVESYAALLDQEERARCDRLRTEVLRRRFIVRRGVLRRLLGAYMGSPPGDIRYAYGGRAALAEGGKPALARPEHEPRLFFNVSDSDSMALYAVTTLGEIGVDIERAVPIADMMTVARDWFSPSEQSRLAALPAHEQTAGFYTCWTRKEAIVKCVGTGLRFPLHSFSVSLTPGEPAALLDAEDARLRAFVLMALPLAEPFIGACAVEPLSHPR